MKEVSEEGMGKKRGRKIKKWKAVTDKGGREGGKK